MWKMHEETGCVNAPLPESPNRRTCQLVIVFGSPLRLSQQSFVTMKVTISLTVL